MSKNKSEYPPKKYKAEFLQNLQDRHYTNQVTHSKELDQLMSKEKIVAYVGFDCTAKSLHIGSLIQIMVLRHLQKEGHQPIVLLGGGTTKIGDPSGKDKSRQVLSEKQIADNLAGIKQTLEKFDLSKDNSKYPKFKFVNNNDWLKDLNYIDFLQDFGRHFSINRMLTFDSVKTRLDRQHSLSFLEFNYMILQAYDFYQLNKNHNCLLQIGGSDQWGNIVNGVELTRRISALDNKQDKENKNTEVYGLTTRLILTGDGKKMGKTEDGTIWLDKEMLDPFDYFQYFRNVDDKDVDRFLRLFTDLESKEIEIIKKRDINQQKIKLAYQTTKICHGQDAADLAQKKTQKIFSSKADNIDSLPEKIISFTANEVSQGKTLFAVLRDIGLCASGSEAKRLIKGAGVKINDQQILDENYLVIPADLKSNFNSNYQFKISLGKKKFFKITIQIKS